MVRQHFVPKFYLKNYARITKKTYTYKIRAYNKKTGKEIFPSIKNIGLENQFYDKTEPPIFEKMLSFLEFYASKIYYKIINKESIEVLSNKERTIFSHFIFTQYTRTKAARELLRQIYDLVYEDLVQTENYPKKTNFDEESFNLFLKDRSFLAQLKIMFDPNEDNNKLMKIPLDSSKLIFNLDWKLLKDTNKIEFYSSDHPIFVSDPNSDGKTIKGYGIQAFESPTIEMYFPLTPRLCLVLLGKDSLKYRNENVPIIINEEDLEWINRQSVAESYQFIYTKNNSFNYVKTVLNKFPELKNINRNRIFV